MLNFWMKCQEYVSKKGTWSLGFVSWISHSHTDILELRNCQAWKGYIGLDEWTIRQQFINQLVQMLLMASRASTKMITWILLVYDMR